MKLELLTDFYIEQLKDAYDAEKQLLKALPEMAKAAESPELREAFKLHAKETQEQIKRLERIFKSLDEKPTGKRCMGMEGLIEEAKEVLEDDAEPEILDVGLVTAAQKVEHYEIASYGCLATYAKLLGFRDHLALLVRTLNEEKATDGKLTLMAEFGINIEAAQGEIESEEDEVSDEEMNEGSGRSGGRNGQPRSQRLRQGQKGKGKSGSQARARAGKSASKGRAGGSQMTTDLEEIREWAEARGGKPAAVRSTGRKNGPGVLRIDFPGYSGGDSLEEISWHEWYDKFQENNLRFLYQDRTKDGKESRFFKLICEPKK
ncbi:MAG TPA: ferritin-like domain-containing protein [Methylomirabilota bacterium]|nr:ferritin-like domain-containing protein [Methylomirabilota bacterium]